MKPSKKVEVGSPFLPGPAWRPSCYSRLGSLSRFAAWATAWLKSPCSFVEIGCVFKMGRPPKKSPNTRVLILGIPPYSYLRIVGISLCRGLERSERVPGKDHALERRCLLMSLWFPTEIELNHYALRSREDWTPGKYFLHAHACFRREGGVLALRAVSCCTNRARFCVRCQSQMRTFE